MAGIRATLALALVTALVWGCGGPVSPSPTEIPTISPTPSPTASPAPTPTMSPTPSSGVTSGWIEEPDQPAFHAGPMGLVAWTGSRFVAADTEDIPTRTWWSADGQGWTQVTGAGAIMGGSVTTLGVDPSGRAMAGNDRGVWASSDGVAWRIVLRDGPVTAIVDGPHEALAFVNGPSPTDPNPPPGRTWISTDDAHWHRIDPPALRSYWVSQAVAVGSGFVAIGQNPHDGTPGVWWSPDGLTWQREPWDPNTVQLDTLVSGQRGLLLTGQDAGDVIQVWVSSDGRHWSATTKLDSDYDSLTPLAVTGESYLATYLEMGTAATPSDAANGDFPETPYLLGSTDGLTWDLTDATALSGPSEASFTSFSYAAGPTADIIVCDCGSPATVWVRPHAAP